ncbi:MAG: hypothetical protein ACFFD8_11180 [Candidatus Thorarchaeota archaeon]
MKKRKDKIGQMRVIETIIASFVVLAALSFVNLFALTPASPGYEMTDLEKMGYSARWSTVEIGAISVLF